METATEPAVEEREELAVEPEATAPEKPRRRRFRALPWKTRLVMAAAGVLLLVLGIAGLFLPFLQGILFLVLAAAVLSLTSERVYGWLRGLVSERWPRVWQRVERFRTRVLWKFRR
jgi:predicted anti-sigma-YlaC factor YlaD